MALNCMIISVSTVHLKEKELQELRTRLQRKEELLAIKNGASNKKIVSSGAFYGMLFLSIILASLAAYGLFFHNSNAALSQGTTTAIDSIAHYNDSVRESSAEANAAKKPVRQKTVEEKKQDSIQSTKQTVEEKKTVTPPAKDSTAEEE